MMAYTGVYVFGDSLVDAGNVLKLANLYSNLTFSDLPEGSPTSALGYFQGRFTDGYTFADLISNKLIGLVTKPVFPFGFELGGVPISPFSGDPSGNNLNFAYGGAQIRQGEEIVQDLDSQTDTFRNAVDGDAPSGALYLVTMGGNDVRSLAPADGPPRDWAISKWELDQAAQQLIHELGQLIDDGAVNFLITGIPDVGLIPKYAGEDADLDPAEAERAAAASQYSIYLDNLIRTVVVPALEGMGANVTYVPIMGPAYTDENGNVIDPALAMVLPTLEALHGLDPGTLTTDLLGNQDVVFFDQVHPTAQTHALVGSYMYSVLTGTPWIETLPLTGTDVDYSTTATISVAGEVDKLVVALAANTTYTFEMLGISSRGTAGSVGDTTVHLLNSAGTVVGMDGDSGAGFDASLTFTVGAAGIYTLEMSAVGMLTGAYTLQAAVISGAAMGDNIYAVSNASTLVIEGADGGYDVVKASASYVLTAGSDVEELRTSNDNGKTAINLTGNELGQTITGNGGANILEGKGGVDILSGLGGKDVFVLSDMASIDQITDYAKGEIVDVSQVLKVAAGTNVTSGGYLRVTTAGLIEVDLDGSAGTAHGWTALSTINGNGSVTLRYASGSSLASVTVNRTGANGSTVLTGAVAAAGLLAAPPAAEPTAIDPALHDAGALQALRIDSFNLEPAVAGTIGGNPSGPQATFADTARVSPAPETHVAFAAVDLHGLTDPMGVAPVPLLQAAEPVAFQSGFTAPAVAVPPAEVLQGLAGSALGPASEAASTAELGRVLADALAGGEIGLEVRPAAEAVSPQLHAVDALVDQFAAVFGAPHAPFAMEALAFHPDAVSAA